MPTLVARDLMQTDVMYVNPETPLLEVHRLFLEEEINGAPVVDDAGRLRGVISSMDLVRAVLEESTSGAPEDFPDRVRDLTAADVMITEVVRVPATASIAEVAEVMRRQRIHRVLVVDDKELVGILTTFDLIGVLEHRRAEGANPRQAGDPVC